MIGKTITIDFVERHLNNRFASRNVGAGLVPALFSHRFASRNVGAGLVPALLSHHFACRNVGAGLVPALLSYCFAGSETSRTHQLYRPFIGITFAQRQFYGACLSPMVDMCY